MEFPDMPQSEQEWLGLWATNPEQAREMTLHMATALEDALPQIAGALLGAWHVRREAEGCQRAASLALEMAGPRFPENAKSAAPTKGAALEMPGLTGGQMVTLPQLKARAAASLPPPDRPPRPCLAARPTRRAPAATNPGRPTSTVPSGWARGRS